MWLSIVAIVALVVVLLIVALIMIILLTPITYSIEWNGRMPYPRRVVGQMAVARVVAASRIFPGQTIF